MEAAAAFSGYLAETIKRSSDDSRNPPIDIAQIESVFERIQKERHARMKTLVAASHFQQQLMAWNSKLLEFADRWIIPLVPMDIIHDQSSAPIVGSQICSARPIPSRPHDLLTYDDLNRYPSSRTARQNILVACRFLILLGTAVYGLGIQPEHNGTMVKLAEVVRSGSYPSHSGKVMQNFDHIPILGTSMSYLIAVYWPATEGWNLPFLLLTFYLTISEFALFATWTAESWRRRNSRNPIGRALVVGLVSNVTAIAFGARIFYLIDILCSSNLNSWWSTSTYIAPQDGQAILPAMLLGFLMPSVLMFTPILSSITRQYTAIVWMFFPLYLTILQRIFKTKLRAVVRYSSVQTLYLFSFGLCASTHWLVLALCLKNKASLTSIFAFRSVFPLALEDGNHNMFLWDFYVTFAAALLWSFVSYLDLQQVGRGNRKSCLGIGLYMIAGTIAVGPAAVISISALQRSLLLEDDVSDSGSFGERRV